MTRTSRKSGIVTSCFFTAMLSLPMALQAADKPTAAELSKAVSDHTYQGSMSVANSGFAEYYAPDGTIHADGYSGKWRVDDGLMCFQYGDKPERCFGVELHGPSLTMFKDGKIDGNGMLIPGNPSKF